MNQQPIEHIEDPRDAKKFYLYETRSRKFFVFLMRQIFRYITSYQVEGIENLPGKGAVVLAANHLTNYDVFPIQLVLPRPLFFMAKAELHKNPLTDAFFRHMGAFPVFRGKKDVWALQYAAKVLAAGQMLAMFPEGTRSKGRGLRTGKTGAARLALQAQCPILPMAITGTHQMFHHFPRRTTVTIRIAPPIIPQPHESPLALTDRLMYTLAACLPPELRGVYQEIPPGFENLAPSFQSQHA